MKQLDREGISIPSRDPVKGTMNKNQLIEYLVTKVHDQDEPLFLLRGRDPLASSVVVTWANVARTAGVPKMKVNQAISVSVEMCMYGHKKLPD